MLDAASTGSLVSEVPKDARVDLRFEGRRATGLAACNRYGGAYTVDGESLSFDAFAVTEMACAEPGLMELESAYLAALGDADTYQVTNNGLVLMGGNVALTFAAEAPPEPMPLVGTGWHVTTIPSGDGAVSSTIAGTEPYMVLADDGSLQGSDGCNTFSGSYEAGEDGTITFGPLATTSMACAPDVMDQATTIGRGLDAAVGFSIEGSTLTLTDGDGAPLLGFSAA